MDNFSEIIRKCYMEILGREPDNTGQAHFLQLMKNGTINETKLKKTLLESEEYKERKKYIGNATKHHPKGNFFIKNGYLHRLQSLYYHNITNEKSIVWQPYVYELAGHIGKKLNCTHIIDIGCGNANKLTNLHPNFEIIGIDHGDNVRECRKKYGFGKWIEWDLEKESYPELTKEILEKSVIVCADVIEHLTDPSRLLRNLHKFLDYSQVCLLTTPERDLTYGKNHFGPPPNPHHIREWNMEEFEQLLRYNKFSLTSIGLTVSNDHNMEKKTIITIVENNHSKIDSLSLIKENNSLLHNFFLCVL